MELTPLSGEDQAVEYLMMSMRLNEGSDLRRYEALAGVEVPEETIDELVDLGMVSRIGDQLRTTSKGRPLLNAILRHLLGA
jgi:oxygen-independent coproporphyrinogen-3 oxidase